jgi:hypothetical protein
MEGRESVVVEEAFICFWKNSLKCKISWLSGTVAKKHTLKQHNFSTGTLDCTAVAQFHHLLARDTVLVSMNFVD